MFDSSETSALSLAFGLHHSCYLDKESKYTLPEELTLELLTHPSLLKKPEVGSRNQMDDYYWTEIGKAFVRIFPKRSLELADKMLEHFEEDGSIFGGFHSATQAVLNEVTRLYPEQVWQQITKYLGPPIDSRAFRIKDWLRGEYFSDDGGEGTLSIIPLERIWEWVDKDVEKHAWYLASFVPKRLFREEGRICLARELLVRYGTREDVQRNLMANFSTEGWWGPASAHFQSKKQQLLDFKKSEDNENVRRWIDAYVSSLDRQIESERIEEEREL